MTIRRSASHPCNTVHKLNLQILFTTIVFPSIFFDISFDTFQVLYILQDSDEFFDHERSFITEYHSRIKDATGKSDRLTKLHKGEFNFTMAPCYIIISMVVLSASTILSSPHPLYCCMYM